MMHLFKMSHQQFYKWRETYVAPWWQLGGVIGGIRRLHTLTQDRILAALLLKMVKNINYITLGVLFGTDGPSLCKQINSLRDFIYENDTWFNRQRNLSNPR